MKKKLLIFLSILLTGALVTYFILLFDGLNNVSRNYTSYLNGLSSKYKVVLPKFQTGDVSSAYSTETHILTITEKNVTYSFTDYGISEIIVDNVVINIDDLSESGKVESIDAFYGDGFDAPRLKYKMSDLNKPTAFYAGDDVKYNDSVIKKALPDDKIKSYIKQGEKYQQEIKKIIESSTVDSR